MISIIVPIYNAGKRRLKRCLNSVCKQTYQNWEVILVNDASTDDSLSICNYYIQKDKRFTLINKTTNEGVEKARYDAIQIIKGKYVTFVDADDWLEKDMLEQARNIIEQYNCDYVETGIRRRLDKYEFFSKKSNYHPSGLLNQKTLATKHSLSFYGEYSLSVNIWGKLYKKELMAFYPSPVGLKHGEDQHVTFILHQHVNSIYRLNKIGYNYLWGGMTSKYHPSLLSDFKRLYYIRLNYLHNNKHSSGFKDKAEYFMSIEAANFLRTEIQQLLLYKKKYNYEDIVNIISKELDSDDVWKRASMCLTSSTISEYFSIFSSLNAPKIVKYVKQKDARNKIKMYCKTIVSYMLRFINE